MPALADGPLGLVKAQPLVVEGAGHQSVLRLRAADLGQSRAVLLGRNKSMLVELPRDLRDVVVSNPEIMDAVVQSSNRVYLIGKKNGQSNAFFFDVNGEQVLTLEVLIEHDTAALDAILNRLLPGASIKSEILNETVILTGSVRSPVDATRAADIASRFIVGPASHANDRHEAKVINMLAVDGEEQVMLRVTVAEVQRSVLKQLGINVGAIVNSGNFVTGLLTENALPLTAARGLGTLPMPGVPLGGDTSPLKLFNQGPFPSTFTNSGLVADWRSGGNVVNGAIRALERDGLLKTLAEPNLTAVSGESAKFLAGGEFPIPVPDGQGGYTIMFKEFGVGLTFTPMVQSEGRISLKIETEVSELTNEGSIVLERVAVPALKTRRAASTVELPSGGSLAIAGLIRDETRQNIDGFPGLKDVPVIGTLFRSRDFIKEETELVVIVTPYTVRPVPRQQLVRPDDGLAPATDMKANFLGHLNRIYGRGSSLPDGGLKGDYGFIVE
ncbi:MAG: type II and III secretion system protein family protein [Hyphomicrobiaceae bacterium]|nr:type II and III secretion system protein family protein [Hyphomicrobiaceae bacterium]